MLLANCQLHAEYAQAFYERTTFFFFIDAGNATRPATTPFWTLPPALLPSLRRCNLDVRLGVLALMPGFSMEALAARIEALLGRMERVRWVHLTWDLRGTGEEWEEWEKQLWPQFGERSVQRLKGIRGTTVTITSHVLWLRRNGAGWTTLESVFLDCGGRRQKFLYLSN
jgi:hypothetical protein